MVIAQLVSPDQCYFCDMIVCYGMQIWLITRLCGFLRLYEVLKWFTPCWTSDFSRYMMQDMILDLLQSVIPRSWNYWVFGVGDSQQDLVPPIRFYNGFHLINGFLFEIQCWSMWYDNVLWDANLVDYRAMWIFWNLYDFMRFWNGLPHVGPVIFSGISWRIWF